MRRGRGTIGAVAVLALMACGDAAGPAQDGRVAVEFSARAGSADGAAQQNGSLVLEGTNGVLRIDQLHVIVDRFELKRLDDDRCGSGDRACEKFVAPPMLLDLPLDGREVIAVQQAVEPDTYRRLRFEIEDLDDDETDPVRAQQIRDLWQAIRARFADWPRDASMLVVGTFTPTGGASQSFRVYFEAEIEIELRLNPPVTVAEGGTFTVELDPALLFRTSTGAVRNLAQLDFSRSGRAHEFRTEIRQGFVRIRFRR
jgi:hypothetical protein